MAKESVSHGGTLRQERKKKEGVVGKMNGLTGASADVLVINGAEN